MNVLLSAVEGPGAEVYGTLILSLKIDLKATSLLYEGGYCS